jgi:hypothetical protein
MAWAQRGGRSYYYRSVREGGRVKTEYVGAGEGATLLAELDALTRAERAEEAEERRAEKERYAEEERLLTEFCDLAEDVARAAMMVSGYRRHKRGEWRKKRGHPRKASEDGSDFALFSGGDPRTPESGREG